MVLQHVCLPGCRKSRRLKWPGSPDLARCPDAPAPDARCAPPSRARNRRPPPSRIEQGPVRAAGEDPEPGERGRPLLLLVDRPGHAGVGDEIELAADQEQRRPIRILPVYRRLVDDPVPIDLARRRDDILVVGGIRPVLRNPLGEAVAEEASRHRLGLPPAAPIEEDRKRRDDRMRAERHSRRRRRIDRDPGDPEAPVEQMLDEHPARGVADQDRLFRALADDPVVMVEYLGDAQAGELFVGHGAKLFRASVVIGPVRRDDGEAPGRKIGRPRPCRRLC